jgi:hypothetical protein
MANDNNDIIDDIMASLNQDDATQPNPTIHDGAGDSDDDLFLKTNELLSAVGKNQIPSAPMIKKADLANAIKNQHTPVEDEVANSNAEELPPPQYEAGTSSVDDVRRYFSPKPTAAATTTESIFSKDWVKWLGIAVGVLVLVALIVWLAKNLKTDTLKEVAKSATDMGAGAGEVIAETIKDAASETVKETVKETMASVLDWTKMG